MKTVAIIGAGLSGLILAQQLKEYANLTIFEKSSYLSGRMATRYTKDFAFDHGAQFFTARSLEFKNFISKLVSEGVIAPWNAHFAEIDGKIVSESRIWDVNFPHYVGIPKMNSIGKYLAHDLPIYLNTPVSSIEQTKTKWLLKDCQKKSLGEYDWVISTAPAQQAAQFIPSQFNKINILKSVKMQGCYALMLGFLEPLTLPWDVALVKNSIISWISVNSSKPKRDSYFSLVVMTTNHWAEEHIVSDKQAIIHTMLEVASQITNHSLFKANYIDLKRWRYANAEKTTLPEPLIDTKNQFAACGDWCISGRVESAFLSAYHMAERLKVLLKD